MFFACTVVHVPRIQSEFFQLPDLNISGNEVFTFRASPWSRCSSSYNPLQRAISPLITDGRSPGIYNQVELIISDFEGPIDALGPSWPDGKRFS